MVKLTVKFTVKLNLQGEKTILDEKPQVFKPQPFSTKECLN